MHDPFADIPASEHESAPKYANWTQPLLAAHSLPQTDEWFTTTERNILMLAQFRHEVPLALSM